MRYYLALRGNHTGRTTYNGNGPKRKRSSQVQHLLLHDDMMIDILQVVQAAYNLGFRDIPKCGIGSRVITWGVEL